MTDLGTERRPPEPAAETHPTKGRCGQCRQPLPRLWLWFCERWTADRYCCPECEEKAKRQTEALTDRKSVV